VPTPEVRPLAFHDAIVAEPGPGLPLVLLVGSVVFALGILPLIMLFGSAAGSVDHRFLGKANQPLAIPKLPQRSTIYAADGSVLERVYLAENRQAVPLSSFRRSTIRAVLAIEDDRFFQHGPLDFPAIARAAVSDLLAGRIVEGGSTITQQLVKDTITGDAPTFERKLREAADAIRVENTYTKRHILDMYLNEIYLGEGVYGIGTAAGYYFGVQPDQLTLAQSALLAGMIRFPDGYDPINHPVHARIRRNEVLGQMHDLGWISKHTLQRTRSQPITLSTQRRNDASTSPNSYWTQFVIASFLNDPAFGRTVQQRTRALYQGGLKIYTTLQPQLERHADTVLADRMSGPGMPQSALVSIVPNTGAITAMAVGNQDFGQNQYNLATDPGGGRTAGSAFKAFTLAAALEHGISPNAVYNGTSPRTIVDCGGGQTWTVHNAEPGGGDYPLWQATADSVNAVFAQVIDQVGPDAVARTAHQMGITSPLVPVCPLTLGTSPVSPLQMTSGYATLANRGIHCQPYAIARVLSPAGRTIYRSTPDCSRAIPRSVADEETAMLEGVIRFGTGTAANIGRPEAGKTGTGQNYQDAWFLGYVPQLCTGVWVGYAKAETPMTSVPGYGEGFGGVLAAPIWHDFMLYVTQGFAPVGFAAPPIPFGWGSSVSTPTTTARSPSPTAAPGTGANGHGNGNGYAGNGRNGGNGAGGH
jgi:penicillin-binding protein 1A